MPYKHEAQLGMWLSAGPGGWDVHRAGGSACRASASFVRAGNAFALGTNYELHLAATKRRMTTTTAAAGTTVATAATTTATAGTTSQQQQQQQQKRRRRLRLQLRLGLRRRLLLVSTASDCHQCFLYYSSGYCIATTIAFAPRTSPRPPQRD